MKRNSYLIGKAFKNYLTASVLTVAATQVANIVDASIVGNLIGPEGLAAVNLCQPLLQAFFATSILYVASTGEAVPSPSQTLIHGRFWFFTEVAQVALSTSMATE